MVMADARDAVVLPEKLAGEFAGNLVFANFDEIWRELQVAARDDVFRSAISVMR